MSIEHIDVDEGRARVAAGALLLDVREHDEWDAGHVPEAVHLVLGELPVRHTELPTDREIVVMCKAGGRSAMATEALVGAGYRAVNVAGGMLAWVEAGLPCVTDAGTPGMVA
jgi:rhodanese-related sulfurtransferase